MADPAPSTLEHVACYAEHLLAYADSYGSTENLIVEQRVARDIYREIGEILMAILNDEEWALSDAG